MNTLYRKNILFVKVVSFIKKSKITSVKLLAKIQET